MKDNDNTITIKLDREDTIRLLTILANARRDFKQDQEQSREAALEEPRGDTIEGLLNNHQIFTNLLNPRYSSSTS